MVENLPSNYFVFESDFFLQIQGVAMGSPFAPNYVNLCRYIDDVFVFWEGSQQELNEFQTLLNKSSEYLRFTMQTDEKK
ncbi:unnamed protein product, partial [Coregonus sp. 'balchen']